MCIRLVKSKPSEFIFVMHNAYYIKKEIKVRVLKLYLARQNLLHTVKFLCWLLIFRGENYKDSSEMIENLKTKVEQLYEIDWLLFGEVQCPIFTKVKKPAQVK